MDYSKTIYSFVMIALFVVIVISLIAYFKYYLQLLSKVGFIKSTPLFLLFRLNDKKSNKIRIRALRYLAVFVTSLVATLLFVYAGIEIGFVKTKTV